MTAVNGKTKKIIIVRKKKVHGGRHHGGSWKVAYADFVTAMMAFFMVMWILGMDENLRKAIEGYFVNPVGHKQEYSSGLSPIPSTDGSSGTRPDALRLLLMRKYEVARFASVQANLRATLDSASALKGFGAQVQVVMEKNGLRIELIEARNGETCFPSGSALMKPVAVLALDLIATELGQLSNPVIIEGHTDAAPFGTGGYTNWELSGDRANAARRVVEAAGMGPRRIVEVRGMADRQLRDPEHPLSPTNRRISLFLPFVVPVAEAAMSDTVPGGAEKQA